MLYVLLNWFKLLYGPFGLSNRHLLYTLVPRPATKESNVPKLKGSYELTVLIYTLHFPLFSTDFFSLAYAAFLLA